MSRRTGEYRVLGSPDTPRKFGSAQPLSGERYRLAYRLDVPSGGLLSEREAMLEQFRAAVTAARNTTALDHVARLLWKAHAEGAIADADAEAIAGAVQARRAAFARPACGVALSQAAPVSARRKPVRPRSPDRQASLERRRRCAMSGAVPARIAASFTMGEVAALSIIARAVREAGVCVLPLDAIAALAGVSRTSAQNAVRAAERLGFLQRAERRRAGQRSETNILKVTSREWTAWLRLGKQGGGLKTLSTTYNHLDSQDKKGDINWRSRTSCDRVNQEHDSRGGAMQL